jgi:hypothetical protein
MPFEKPERRRLQDESSFNKLIPQQGTRRYSLTSRNISSSSMSRPRVFARRTWWAQKITFVGNFLLWGFFGAGNQRSVVATAIDKTWLRLFRDHRRVPSCGTHEPCSTSGCSVFDNVVDGHLVWGDLQRGGIGSEFGAQGPGPGDVIHADFLRIDH